ncbi:HlyD family secretion protein [Psychromonas sp. Urea-02u-13]|uniref:HlyD family secretion protein n=1 Tax=Psychromonas sp. Urea-02u-13 TaxID=2058326 RepID=UPI000C34A1F0|nr:HlyD family secretion protein [Psychromonas sp. Urea-02u-13]PKG40600.1 HlyD family secretion protein [Psychromonas sp. Urea-02u-13]
MTKENEKTEQSSVADVAEEVVAVQKDPVRRITKIVLIAVAFVFVWYVIADRHAPWSDQARIHSYVIPVVPQVSGRIVDVDVEKDQVVDAGKMLFRIDASDYELAVETAESSLELAGQEIGAGVATVVTAQAQLVVAETNLEHIQAQSARVFEMEKKQVFSKSEGDKARAAIKQGKAQVRSAEAGLDKAKQALGAEGDKNPRIRSAMANLKQAQLNLSRTTVLAPSFGGITNLQVDEGFYANAGQPVMTFVEFGNIWLQVNLRENNLANLKIGNPVEISLDVQPGTIYSGKISSIGFAVNSSTPDAIGGLNTVEGTTGWLRDAQRFPVMISFDDIASMPKGSLRAGGQADVQVYTGDNWFVNSMGWLWIRALSWLSYVY